MDTLVRYNAIFLTIFSPATPRDDMKVWALCSPDLKEVFALWNSINAGPTVDGRNPTPS